MKLLLVIAFVVVAYALIVGRARRRGSPSKAADQSYILLANAARYFLYAAGVIVVVFAVAVFLQIV